MKHYAIQSPTAPNEQTSSRLQKSNMKTKYLSSVLLIWLLPQMFLAYFGAHTCSAQSNETIDFSLQIRPILSEHCFHCHGPDEAHRQADLRLDTEEGLRGITNNVAIVAPGEPSASQLWIRIISDNAEQVMPPPSAHKTLKPEQRELIRKWIESGAGWGEHWSFKPPTKRELPSTVTDPWGNQPIDAWILAGLKNKGLTPARSAAPETLCRRIHIDLIGIPPTQERTHQFTRDFNSAPDKASRLQVVEALADELLQRPEYGEHWARVWLDLGRYADTKGYEKDRGRDMWPFRDWVINALNADMPFDQFTIEQIAGDLLSTPTADQTIATAFHRATLSNDEGGTDDEEFRIAAVKDRVDTTLQVWMGLTMGCAKCHSHKYDPITQEDYYRVFAIFNQTEDADRYDDEPRLTLPTDEHRKQLAALENTRSEIEAKLAQKRKENSAERDRNWLTISPSKTKSEHGSELTLQPDSSVLASGNRPDRDIYHIAIPLPPGNYPSLRLEALTAKIAPSDTVESVGRSPADPNFVLSEISLQLATTDAIDDVRNNPTDDNAVEIERATASFEQDNWPIVKAFDREQNTGWAIANKKHESHWGIFSLKNPIVVEPGKTTFLHVKLSQQFGGGLLLHRVRLAVSTLQADSLIPSDDADTKALAKELAQQNDLITRLRESIPKLPILKELASDKQRVTRIHQRGSFLDPGDEVKPAVLATFGRVADQDSPNRLGLARWLVSKENPLTARVAVNRVWSQIFGRGLVETEEDFGSQGALPSHPELLDWLAVEFRDSLHWSQKRLIRTIVLSNVYQQAYENDPLRKEKDPRNVWLSRGARYRLSAESIRDSALSIAGLLSNKRGGPPVMPPQPEGLWRSTYSDAKWITSVGEDRYRRGIYTYWKRTTPYPSMESFDSSTREVCQIRRITTNTPLQSLVTLNDPVYVEAANALAYRLLTEKHANDIERLQRAMQLATSRGLTDKETSKLVALLESSRSYFHSNPQHVAEHLRYSAFERNKDIVDAELAAWSIVASAILNLDETLSRS